MIALVPLYFMSYFYYGSRVLFVGAFSALLCLACDWACNYLLYRRINFRDLISLVTGIIISMLIGVTTAGALGNLYGLMSMRRKIILTIALLASFFVLCWLAVRLVLLVTPERAVMMIQSINHPIVWNGLGLIWVALMVGIDYLCALHMQLRRD